MKASVFVFLLLLMGTGLKAEDGSSLWLRNNFASPVNVVGSHKSLVFDVAKQELLKNWQGNENATINLLVKKDKRIKGDGFILSSNKIQANTDLGILYGVFELLRQQQTLQIASERVYNPSYELRLLNHWDNLNSSVERGYAGSSIFWRTGEDRLVVTVNDKRIWTEYARANASIGINGAAINNVNASPDILRPHMLERVKAIADILRTYGLKVYISINFSSPAIVGGLDTSDPLDSEVINWWNARVKEIYTLIPDFGGFLVKANSEGQPGPQDFGRTHVDGANMMADAVKPYGGIIMWRAFVYSPEEDDRAKQAYAEFVPFDGQFRENVIV